MSSYKKYLKYKKKYLNLKNIMLGSGPSHSTSFQNPISENPAEQPLAPSPMSTAAEQPPAVSESTIQEKIVNYLCMPKDESCKGEFDMIEQDNIPLETDPKDIVRIGGKCYLIDNLIKWLKFNNPNDEDKSIPHNPSIKINIKKLDKILKGNNFYELIPGYIPPLELIKPESIAIELEKINEVENVDYEVSKGTSEFNGVTKTEISNKMSFDYKYNNLNYIVSFASGFGTGAGALLIGIKSKDPETGEEINVFKKTLRKQIADDIPLKIDKKLLSLIKAFIYYYED